jgi:hypothetical protein
MKLDFTYLPLYQEKTKDYDTTVEEIEKHIEQFNKDFDKNIFDKIIEYKTNSKIRSFDPHSFEYRELMRGCYDVIYKPIDLIDWHLAKNIFYDLVEEGRYIDLKNGRFSINENLDVG